MASLQAKVDAVRAAVSSTSSCSPATVVTLKELLLPESEPAARVKPAARATKTTATPKSKTNGATKKAAGAQCDEPLGGRERTVLATHVINATLKSLADAAKPSPSSTPCKRNGGLRRPTSRRSLRRSTSAPLSPLQPRTLNRVATSPNLTTKNTKPVPPSQSTGCLATVECARVAFTCLRSVKGPVQDGQADFQLENGMSALVGKLVALGMHDQALRELRILKQRLDGPPPTAATKNTNATPDSVTAGIADLLAFQGSISKQMLPTITACQTQVLKLVSATKKPVHIEALLPALHETNPSSPINLLSRLAEGSDKEAPKAARQLASVSQLLLSIVPSVSSSEDTVAMEPRLSPIPTVALELQALAFRTQLKWWKLAGHQGNVDDEIRSPFTRCIRALVRRQESDDRSAYRTIATAFEGIMQIIRSQKHEPATSSKSPLAAIYQILGSTAHSARQYNEAYPWLQSLKSCLCPQTDSSVRICSVSARILAAALKAPEMGTDIEQLVREVTDGLDGSLSGTVTELNELLESLSAARRSVVGLLMNILDPNSTSTPVSEEVSSLLKTFILRYPRFVRRWMGTPPAKDAGAKQVLQFDQRRQMVMQSINQILDAALTVIKCGIQARSMEWQLMDDVLQHCASLLGGVSDPVLSIAKTEQLGAYHVKISSLYFSEFLELRKMSSRSKEANKQLLQALSRSIDAVKERTTAEKEKAQLSTKLELFADLCKGAGRADDAVRTLRSICTNMAEDGVLSDVAAALTTKAPALAWATTEKASSLSRTLRSIAKLDRSWNDWTFFLPEAERAAMLEHLMHLSSSNSTSFQPLRLHDPSLTALLRIYTLERYPIRRLRVLLHLFYQNIGGEDEVDELASHLDQAVQQLQRKDKAEDASLSHYIPHLQAYHAFMSALADGDTPLPISLVKHSVSSWKTMTKACQTKEDLYEVIDNPESLLDHLQSLNHLAGLRGESQLQLSISELSITLAKAIADCAGSIRDSLVLNHSHLAAQHVNIGRYAEAQKALEETKALIEQNEGISRGVVADFYLSQAEYYAGIGSFDEAMKCISKANDICGESYSSWAHSKSQATVMLSMASFLQSTVSLQKGDVQDALTAIKSSVRMLSHDWSRLEAASASTSPSAETSMAETSMTSIDVQPSQSRTSGPRFWSLASPLLRSLLHISSVYAHIGMFQETIYYAESAWKIAESTQSSLYKAQVSAWTGSVYVKAGRLDKALPIFEEAKDQMPRDACSSRVRFARQLGEFYCEMGNEEGAHDYLKIAEDTVHLLSGTGEVTNAPGHEPTTEDTPTKKSTAAARTVRVTRATKAKATAAPRTTKRGPATKAKSSPPLSVSDLPRDVYQSSLLTAVILSRAMGLIHQKDWSSALSTLEQAKELPKLLGTLSQEQVITATSLIGQSMEQMISDPVFSVMQDSTISFPALCGGTEKGSSDRSPASTSPPRRGRGVASDRRGARAPGGPAFADALKQAQELLMQAHASAMSSADSSMVHRICKLLQSTIILLSATSAAKSRPAVSSGLATVAVDLGRNITWTREQNTLKVPGGPGASASTSPKALSSSTRRSSLGLSTDLTRFQRTYVEMIPKNWSVISMSLTENRHDLCITKLQAGHSPFILRLPLERANSRDADSEVFNFEHGREELVDIIKLANETSHSARDFAAKGERSAWWSEREALDSRLKDLLVTIETTWLGGFKGIFSQHRRRPDLLARFQKSFQQILDASLPSRNRIRGKKTTKAQTVTLDPRILDLFIGLGDPTEPDCDYDEALNDLLYFVVDILQFHGERNAYDEIDFDAMVVETYDALRGYYNAAKSAEREDGAHTVLVLDKALHGFPWESLPCMADLAVSRVPSLACLRQLMAEAKMPATAGADEPPRGHYVSAKSGTYILNPSSDLKNTQAFFQAPFQTLKSWSGIVNRAPQEADFEQALSTSEVVLYFGHGSGAQYVRGKTVRRLDRCRPATFLMGCSSAALTEAGEFECYGPVWNYMMAGCPAVVGTLWDVTDRDIDRFAGRAFEEWGLFPRGTFEDDEKRNRGTGRGRQGGGRSLAEAVMRAREACKFKYLNAAAVVVYGIPVYITEDTDGV
ncbi:Separin [Tolypocladium ophioglossoides CBS 100239]|uniref:separase n=1 Tax=Tolypocladium ophioglossoides (strain CBS 100239) TaxID=1163406 RepID=A0A0L0NEE7_TOLOC|nr:Separin [Tolypocladium ophioglossoides CBS 100239]